MNNIPIIYENEEIIIINKPSGVASQGGEGIAHPLDKELPIQLGYPVFLVHRLDKETSGLMILAKSAVFASKWTKLIFEKSVKKEYMALCIGKLQNKNGSIKEDIYDKGVKKSATTFYEVVKEIEVPISSANAVTNAVANAVPQGEKITLSLLHLTLGTGRMHQLRIHLAHAGFPIAGDDKHGDFKTNKALKKSTGIKRLMLTALSLSLPVDGKNRTFEIPLPDYFNILTNSL